MVLPIELKRLGAADSVVIATHEKLGTFLKRQLQGVSICTRHGSHALADQGDYGIAKTWLTLCDLYSAALDLSEVVDIEPFILKYELQVVVDEDYLRLRL